MQMQKKLVVNKRKNLSSFYKHKSNLKILIFNFLSTFFFFLIFGIFFIGIFCNNIYRQIEFLQNINNQIFNIKFLSG